MDPSFQNQYTIQDNIIHLRLPFEQVFVLIKNLTNEGIQSLNIISTLMHLLVINPTQTLKALTVCIENSSVNPGSLPRLHEIIEPLYRIKTLDVFKDSLLLLHQAIQMDYPTDFF